VTSRLRAGAGLSPVGESPSHPGEALNRRDKLTPPKAALLRKLHNRATFGVRLNVDLALP